MRLDRTLFCGLLFLSPTSDSLNSGVSSAQSNAEIYVKNAILLNESLRIAGFRFRVYTNDRVAVIDAIRKLSSAQLNCGEIALDVNQFNFTLQIPKKFNFASAHYKIDLFRHFSTLPEKYILLIDLDVVCIAQPNSSFLKLLGEGTPIYYDITRQVAPAYGIDIISRDKERLSNRRSDHRWAGGELIGGTPSFFVTLSAVVESLLPRYFNAAPILHHQGDEMLVSSSFDALLQAGWNLHEAGSLGVIERFWSGRIRHNQPRFQSVAKAVFLIHLPQDKRFLADYAMKHLNGFNSAEFLTAYTKYLAGRRIRSFVADVVDRLRFLS